MKEPIFIHMKEIHTYLCDWLRFWGWGEVFKGFLVTREFDRKVGMEISFSQFKGICGYFCLFLARPSFFVHKGHCRPNLFLTWEPLCPTTWFLKDRVMSPAWSMTIPWETEHRLDKLFLPLPTRESCENSTARTMNHFLKVQRGLACSA